MFGNDIINESLLLLGVSYVGNNVATAAQLATCQLTLNNMLAEWNAQGLAIFSVVRETFTLTNGTASYVIGPDQSGQWQVPRPEKIEAWAVYDASGASNGGSPVDSKTFAKMADDRSLTSALITMLYYDAAYPDATIRLYPIPTGGTLELWVWEEFSVITDFVATAINLPPGYLNAIIYNLAVEIAPKFGGRLSPGIQDVANSTRQTLGATNISEMTRIPPAAPKAA
jgi:hypothetical protein